MARSDRFHLLFRLCAGQILQRLHRRLLQHPALHGNRTDTLHHHQSPDGPFWPGLRLPGLLVFGSFHPLLGPLGNKRLLSVDGGSSGSHQPFTMVPSCKPRHVLQHIQFHSICRKGALALFHRSCRRRSRLGIWLPLFRDRRGCRSVHDPSACQRHSTEQGPAERTAVQRGAGTEDGLPSCQGTSERGREASGNLDYRPVERLCLHHPACGE